MKKILKRVKHKKIWLGIYLTGVHVMALVGIVFVGMYFAIKFKITNVSGKVDVMSQTFAKNAEELISEVKSPEVDSQSGTPAEVADIDSQIEVLNKKKEEKIKYLCNLEELSYIAPKNIQQVIAVKKKTGSDLVVSQMMFAIKTHMNNLDEVNTSINECIKKFDDRRVAEELIEGRVASSSSKNIFDWPDKKEWSDVKLSIGKDKDLINKAAKVAGIDPRLIVSNLMVEQLRLFYSQRELYKKYFEPLKILANSYKISLGVMAIKEETAVQIEAHLKDSSSPYYLGKNYENLLDYPERANKDKERFNRLSSNNHYDNYLYGALYLKQMMTQWKNDGYDLTNRPEIIGTLFNVGFAQSKPNANPKVGGSTVKIDQTDYSFGRLAYEFYYSGEMVDDFPLGFTQESHQD